MARRRARADPRHRRRRRRRARGGDARRATTSSRRSRPTASSIVYRAVGRRRLRGPDDGEHRASTSSPAAGGARRALREEGSDRSFDAHRTRVFFRERRGDRHGARQRRARRRRRTSSVHLALRERHRDRAVARRQVGRVRGALPRLRRAVSASGPAGRVGPTTKALPVARVTRDAGEYLHWSGDSQPPALGARARAVHARARRRSPSCAAAPRSPTRRRRPASTSASSSASRHAGRHGRPWSARRIMTMSASAGRGDRGRHRRRRGQPHQGGRAAGAVRCRPARARIDVARQDDHPRPGRRRTGTPRREQTASSPRQNWPLAANLAFGVTTSTTRPTTRERSSPPRELQRAGALLGPRIFSTGTILYGAGDAFKAEVENFDDALRAPAPDEGGGRLQRQELQPAAARRAPEDPRGRARAGDDGRARGRLAASTEHDAWSWTATPASSTRSRCRTLYKDVVSCSRRAGSATRRR